MVVHRQLLRNQPAAPVDRPLKAEVPHPPNPLDSFPSLEHNSSNPCLVLINSGLDNSHSSHNSDSFQGSLDHRVELHLAHSAKEVMGFNRDRSPAHSRFHLVQEVMVDQDHNLVPNPSQLVDQVMVARVARHRLLDRNPPAADTIMGHMAS